MKRVIGNNHASTGGKLEVDNWKVKSERGREMKKIKECKTRKRSYSSNTTVGYLQICRLLIWFKIRYL